MPRRTNNATARTNNGKTKEGNDGKEPDVPWKDSKAKQLLYQDILDGIVPLEARGVNGYFEELELKEIYTMQPEYADYLYTKFSSRLSSLRTTIRENNRRARQDQESYEKFRSLHPPSLYSKHGYIQWQGSDAKRQLREDLESGKVDTFSNKRDLWESRTVYYSNFPLNVFRGKLEQMIRTDKYRHTLKVKGKLHRAS